MAEELPSIFDYLNYRDYLRDFYAWKKNQSGNFSYRLFARMAGLGSPGHLIMVIQGGRNLTAKTVNKFCEAIKLSKKQASFFENLVFFNQAKTEKDKEHYFERLNAQRPKVKFTGLKKDQFDLLSKKHLPVILQMVHLADFKNDPFWIAERLKFSISPEEVREAIATLIRLGLVKEERGRLVEANQFLTTDAEVDSFNVYKFHREMLGEAKMSLINTNSVLRDITSLTVPVPKSLLNELKNKIDYFKEDVVDWLSKKNLPFDEVYQLNVQLFPVTKKKST